MEYIFYFILFAILGVAHEVFWTGLLDSIKNKNPRLTARSSLWMFPIYGGLFFIIIFVQNFFYDQNFIIRALLYGILIILWEYVSGYIIRKITGFAPWDYSTNKTHDGVGSKKKYQLHGLICLEYFPIWAIEGLLVEYLYIFLKNYINF